MLITAEKNEERALYANEECVKGLNELLMMTDCFPTVQVLELFQEEMCQFTMQTLLSTYDTSFCIIFKSVIQGCEKNTFKTVFFCSIFKKKESLS